MVNFFVEPMTLELLQQLHKAPVLVKRLDDSVQKFNGLQYSFVLKKPMVSLNSSNLWCS
jgi:hypothetical protein